MPATTTTRTALTKPDGNPVTGDFVDITVINANMDKIDAFAGASICTSAARPATPFDGQLARETDTRRVIVRNATSSVWDPVSGAFTCTAATRPGTPHDGQLIRETDTRRVAMYNSTQAEWQNVNGAYICTSATRPGVPFDGMLIRETDTRRVYVYNATQAVWDLIYNGIIGPPTGVLFAQRTANSAGKQNNTMANDTQLVLPVVSGGIYFVDSQIIYTSPTAAQFQAGWSGPAASTFDWASWGVGQSVTAFEGVIKVEARTLAQTSFNGGAAATILTMRPGGLFVAGANGSLTFQWAQAVTTASNTIVNTNSWVRAMRVG